MTLTDEAKRLGFSVVEHPYIHPQTAVLIAADGTLIFCDGRPPPSRWGRWMTRLREWARSMR